MKYLKLFETTEAYQEAKDELLRPCVSYDRSSIYYKKYIPANEIWFEMSDGYTLNVNDFSDLWNFTSNEGVYSENIKDNITISNGVIRYNFNISTLKSSGLLPDSMSQISEEPNALYLYLEGSLSSIFSNEVHIKSLIFPKNFEIPKNSDSYILSEIYDLEYLEYKGNSIEILEEELDMFKSTNTYEYRAKTKVLYVVIDNKYYTLNEIILEESKTNKSVNIIEDDSGLWG